MKILNQEIPINKLHILGAGISLMARVLHGAEKRRQHVIDQRAFFNWMDEQ